MRAIVYLGSVLLVAGCSSMPAFDAPDDGKGPTVATIVDKIQCEIAEARDEDDNQINLKGLKPFGKWSASVALSLTVNDNVGTAATGLSLSYVKPLHIASTSWGINASPLLYQQRTRTFAQNYTINIADIPSNEKCRDLNIQQHGFNLEGDLGLRDQIYAGLHAFASNQGGADIYSPAASGGKSLDNFGATVMFHIYKGITGVGPAWTLVSFKNSGGVGYQRDDQHQIVITFAPAGLPPVPVPTVPPKPIPPTKPTPPVAHGESITSERAQKYQSELEAYQEDLKKYSGRLDAYKTVKKQHDDAIAANATSARIGSAGERARAANQNLVIDQAIRNLGSILSRP